MFLFFFFFKQKTAYEMRISDLSSDVCSSDLRPAILRSPDRTVSMQLGAQAQDPRRRLIGIGAVVAFHALLIWALAAGLAHKMISILPPPIETSSEERRVGKGCVSTCRSRWSPYH